MGFSKSCELYFFPAFVIGWGVKLGMDFHDVLSHLFTWVRILLEILLAG